MSNLFSIDRWDFFSIKQTIYFVFKLIYFLFLTVCSLRIVNDATHLLHLWPVRLYNILPHYLINGTVFEKVNIIEYKMCASILSKHFVWTFLVLRIIERNINKNVHRSLCNVLVVFFLSEFNASLSTDYRKTINTKFHKNSSNGSEGGTDRHDELTVAFRNFAKGPKMTNGVNCRNIAHT